MASKLFHQQISQTALSNITNIGSSVGNTDHPDWAPLDSKDLKPWEDFDARSFEFLYPKLWVFVSETITIRTPPRMMATVSGEDSIESLLSATIVIAIGELLESVEKQLKRKIWLTKTSFCNLGTQISASSKPDWHCSMGVNTVSQSSDYCPCDTKSGNKFKPDELFGIGGSDLEYELMLPVRQIAHYCKVAGTRYGFIMTERELVVLRIAFEEMGHSTSLDGRVSSVRKAAPLPGTLRDLSSSPPAQFTEARRAIYSTPDPIENRFSGLSDMSMLSNISERMDSMSLDSFGPEDPTTVELRVFPWAERRHGLTGFGALAFLLILATEGEQHGIGHRHSYGYEPLHIVTEKVKGALWISELNGNEYTERPPKWVQVNKAG